MYTTLSNPTVTVTDTTFSAAGGTWQAKQVDVSYFHTYTFLGPVASLVSGSFSSVTLTAQATMRTEAATTCLP